VRAYDVRSGKLRWSFHTIPMQANLVMTPGRKTLGKRAAPQQLGWNGR